MLELAQYGMESGLACRMLQVTIQASTENFPYRASK